MKNRWTIVVAALLALVVVVSMSGCAALGGVGALALDAFLGSDSGEAEMSRPAEVDTSRILVAPVGDVDEDDALTALELTLGRLYETVSPSVVHISVKQKVEFGYGIPSTPFGFGMPEDYQYQRASGSGFVWDDEGHVVTNNHVVEKADEITVQFSDGSIAEATVVGTDPDSDLAVIKVEGVADQLVPVAMGDSTQVKVGQLAVAIGNPFSLDNSLSVGFVSALGRSLSVDARDGSGASYSIPDIIQTDAAINPGNSGGVLINRYGQVIGVTTAIVSPVEASVGVGFAVPSVIVNKVVPHLIEDGHYADPWIGISGVSMTPDLALAMDLEAGQRGALVLEVTPDSPADEADVRGSDRIVTLDGHEQYVGGDIIIGIEDEPVLNFDDLVRYLSRYAEVGDTITLTVLRDGREKEIQVTLQERPGTSEQQIAVREARGAVEDRAWLGVQGVTLVPDLAEAMGLDRDQTGVLVLRVVADSPADEAGLAGGYRPTSVNGHRIVLGGDVIVAWDGEEIEDWEALQNALAEAAPGDEVTLTVLRDGEALEVELTLVAAN